MGKAFDPFGEGYAVKAYEKRAQKKNCKRYDNPFQHHGIHSTVQLIDGRHDHQLPSGAG